MILKLLLYATVFPLSAVSLENWPDHQATETLEIPHGISCAGKPESLYNGQKCSRVFWRCVKGLPVIFNCPHGLFFSEQQQTCTYKPGVSECNPNNVSLLSDHESRPQVPESLLVNCTDRGSGFHEIAECYRDFMQCTNGQSLVLRCPGDMVFSENTETCDYFENCNIASETITRNARAELTHSDTEKTIRHSRVFSCKGKPRAMYPLQPCYRNFIYCDGEDTAILLRCDEGFLFDDGQCVLENRCVVRSRVEIAQPPPTNYNCSGKENGIYEEGKCFPHFIVCNNGDAIKMPCPDELFFAVDRCVWLSICQNPPPSTSPIPTVPQARVEEPTAPFDCEGGMGEREIGYCQSEYVICSNNIAIHRKCPRTLVFSQKSGRCMWERQCHRSHKTKHLNLQSKLPATNYKTEILPSDQRFPEVEHRTLKESPTQHDIL